MDKTIRSIVVMTASVFVVAGHVNAQHVGAASASAPASSDTLPSDPTVAPWAPPGGHPAKIDMRTCARPAYPADALRTSAQGATEVMFTIDSEGKLVDGAILKSAGETHGHKSLDHAVLYTFGHCQFTPGTNAQGSPTTTRTTINYVWKIE